MNSRAAQRLCKLCIFLTRQFAATAWSEDWPKYRHDLSNTGLSGETAINFNVNSLRQKWAFQTGNIVSASPAVATVNGTSIMYVGSWNGSFYALNAVTGSQIWKFQVDAVAPCTASSCRIGSSPAVSGGIVYFGAQNAFLYALNAATGALVWKTQLGNPNNGYEVKSSPAVYNGVVYVGVASHDDAPCVVGQVVARNASTGAAVWSFNTIDQTSCSGGGCVGGGVWSSPAIDTADGILYVGTGHPGSTCSPSTPNATKYPDSVLALNLSNGVLLHYFQADANDTSGNDFGSSPTLFGTYYLNTCTGQNSSRSFVAEANENGLLYVLDLGLNGNTVQKITLENVSQSLIASPAAAWHFLEYSCTGEPWDVVKQYSETIVLPSTVGHLSNVQVSPFGNATLSAQIAAPDSYSAPASMGGGTLYFFGAGDNLYASDGSSLLWSFATGGVVYSGPAISNGRIYFGSNDGYVRCLSINGQ